MLQFAVVLKRRTAEPKRINLIKNTFISPHSFFLFLSFGSPFLFVPVLHVLHSDSLLFYHKFRLFSKIPVHGLFHSFSIFLTHWVYFGMNQNTYIDFSTSFYLLFYEIHPKSAKKSPISTKLSTLTLMSFPVTHIPFLSKTDCRFRFFLSLFVSSSPSR